MAQALIPKRSGRTLVFFSLLLLLFSAAAPAASAYTPSTDDDGAPVEPANIFWTGNLTIENRPFSTCEGEPVFCVEDDSAEVQDLAADYGFSVNPTPNGQEEPLVLKPHHIQLHDYDEDGDGEDGEAWHANISDKDWLDASQWTKTNDEAGDTFSATTRNGVDVLHIKEAGGTEATADTDTYTLDFSDITSDAEKHRLILGIEVVNLPATYSGSNVTNVKIYDANGTGIHYFDLGPDGSNDPDGTTQQLVNGTGVVFWDEVVTDGSTTSGGISGDIGKLEFKLSNKDNVATEFYVYALGLQVKRYEFGQDSDGDPIYNMTYTSDEGAPDSPAGQLNLTTLDPSFEYTNIQDLEVSYRMMPEDLPEDQVKRTRIEAPSGFDAAANYEITWDLPDWVDTTYQGDEEIRHELELAGSQYGDITTCGTDSSSDYEDQEADTLLTLDSTPPTVDTGDECTYEADVFWTASQSEHVFKPVVQIGTFTFEKGSLMFRLVVLVSGGLGLTGLAALVTRTFRTG